MKASFFRDVPDFKSLCYYRTHRKGIIGEYCTIAVLSLNDEEIASLLSNFQQSFEYLNPFIDRAIVVHGIWNCVSIALKGWELLVVTNHYQYPRYLAIMPK